MTCEVDPNTVYFETPWVWYGHFPCGSANYGLSYTRLGRFETVAGFWNMYNTLPSIDCVHDGTIRIKGQSVVAYSLFRDGVLPEWEDSRNLTGSEWGCRETLIKSCFHQLWRNYALAAIGENIPHCVGIRAINKSNRSRCLHKIEVWMDKIDTPSIQLCRRSLTAIVPSSPRFVHMPHQQKQFQAQEFQKRRRTRNGSLVARSITEDDA